MKDGTCAASPRRVVNTGMLAGCLLGACWLVGCGSDGADPGGMPAGGLAPVTQAPVQSTPLPSGPYVVRGEVFSQRDGLLATSLDLIVFGARTYRWQSASGTLLSDGSGRFEADHVESSSVVLTAHRNGYVQPCAEGQEVQGDVFMRVEVMPVETFEVFNAPRPMSGGEPHLTGEVYESTAEGRRPVSGARILVDQVYNDGETFQGTYVLRAFTLSDLGGGYYLCRLDGRVSMLVQKQGFRDRIILVNLLPNQTLDIELQRL